MVILGLISSTESELDNETKFVGPNCLSLKNSSRSNPRAGQSPASLEAKYLLRKIRLHLMRVEFSRTPGFFARNLFVLTKPLPLMHDFEPFKICL